MKTAIGFFSRLCAGSLLAAAAHHASAAGPYLKAEAGPTITEDTEVRDFLGIAPGSKIEFDPGFRFAVGGGYAFTDFLAIGGETGVSWNTIENIEGASSEGDSSIGNVPLMGNIIFKLPNKSRIVPFVGGGAGVSFVWLNAESIRIPTTGGGAGAGGGVPAPSDTILDGSDSDAVFAWQLFGGLKYQLNDNMSLGVSYKYLHAESPEWEAEDDFGFPVDLRTGDLETHAVTFVFNLKF
jgi:opacity protein-like surface antigen